MSMRHAHQRARRAALKADTVVLLDRITCRFAESLTDAMRLEIAEMRMRLAPTPGVKAPVIYTGYSRSRLSPRRKP